MFPVEVVYGTAVALAVDSDGPLVGILLQGPAGSGKSSLALGLIENCPWKRSALIADDICEVETIERGLRVRAPQQIKGLIEIRGIGPIPVKSENETLLVAGFHLSSDVSRISSPVDVRMGTGSLRVWPFCNGPESFHRIRPVVRAILSGQMP